MTPRQRQAVVSLVELAIEVWEEDEEHSYMVSDMRDALAAVAASYEAEERARMAEKRAAKKARGR